MPIYCATKAAMHSFSISLRHQLKNTPVKVFEVIPPPVISTVLCDMFILLLHARVYLHMDEEEQKAFSGGCRIIPSA